MLRHAVSGLLGSVAGERALGRKVKHPQLLPRSDVTETCACWHRPEAALDGASPLLGSALTAELFVMMSFT